MTAGGIHCAGCGAWLPGMVGDPDTACDACNVHAELLANKLLDRAAAQLRPALNEKNRAKLDAMTPDDRRRVAMYALEAGIVTWRIR